MEDIKERLSIAKKFNKLSYTYLRKQYFASVKSFFLTTHMIRIKLTSCIIAELALRTLNPPYFLRLLA